MEVHRSRFVPYPTSAISALAFSRTGDSGNEADRAPALKLAIGRANGNIEIWNPQKGLWVQETVFLGDGRGVDGVLWTQDSDDHGTNGEIVRGQHRLFSIASSPAVTEWDLASGQPKRRSTGNFSEVWCFAAQPRLHSAKKVDEVAVSQDIVAGCGDGTLVLLSTAEGDLQFKRFLARVSGKKARCMCIAYQKRDRVVAGFADSFIRVYDTRNGSMLRSMSLGVGVPGAPKNALVWQVKCLRNGDIVSGDSNGEVRFWDGKTYSLSQRIAGHESDCLDLVTSNDGRMIFSGSIDGKIAVYRQVDDQGRKTWAKSSHRRVHRGDIKAMASFDSPSMSVVVTGGADVSPVVTPLREYGKENIRFLPTLPQSPALTSAPKARLLVSWWDKTISIWRVAKKDGIDALPEPERPRKLVACMTLDTKDNIQSVTISSDGRLLAAATATTIKAFQLRQRIGHDGLAIRKMEVPHDLATSGARLLNISPNDKWMAAVTPESEIYIARFVPHSTKPKQLQILNKTVELDRQLRKPQTQSAFRDYDRGVTQVAFSEDSAVLVASDLAGCLDSWVLQGVEDLSAPAVGAAKAEARDDSSDSESDSESDSSDDDDSDIAFYGQRWIDNRAGHLLPTLDSAPLVMTFRPEKSAPAVNGDHGSPNPLQNGHSDNPGLSKRQYHLWILTSQHQMYEFDILSGRLTDWSRRNPSALLPSDFTSIRDRVMGSVWDISEHRERLWLYGSSFVVMLNIGADLRTNGETHHVSKKRSRQLDAGSSGDETRRRRKLESGAGGRTTSDDLMGVADVFKRFDGSEVMELSVDGVQKPVMTDEDEDGDEADAELVLARRKESTDEQVATIDGLPERKWWCTFKYRPILGMVPIADQPATDDSTPLEVVLVERPAEMQ